MRERNVTPTMATEVHRQKRVIGKCKSMQINTVNAVSVFWGLVTTEHCQLLRLLSVVPGGLQQILSFGLSTQGCNHLIGAAGIDCAAGVCQDRGQLGHVATPFHGIQSGWFQQCEFAAQQDHPQAMSEQNTLLLGQIASFHEAIDVSPESQQIANTPDATNIDV